MSYFCCIHYILIIDIISQILFQVQCESNLCHKDWSNECKFNSDCCSKNCFLGENNNWSVGVCKPTVTLKERSITTTSPITSSRLTCHPDWFNQCTKDDECCSNNCFRGENNNWSVGVCQPHKLMQIVTTTSPITSSRLTCHPDWFNQCTKDDECCSGLCFLGNQKQWKHGICISSIQTGNSLLQISSRSVLNPESPCKSDWDNHCSSDEQCCSNDCYKGVNATWMFGVCKSRREVYSKPLNESFENECVQPFFSGCHETSDCCSINDTVFVCDRKYSANTGRCMPNTALTLIDINKERISCFENWYEYCMSGEQCCSGSCYFGKNLQVSDINAEANATYWRYGVCVPDIKVIPVKANLKSLLSESRNQQQRSRRSIKSDKRIVCYVGTWANYKPGDGKFLIEDIDPELCTHIIYGFAKIENNRITSYDPWLDQSKEDNVTHGHWDAYRRFNELKDKHSSLKTLIAIGGWNDESAKYSAMSADASTREIFADSVVEFLEKYNFDGLDLDWEYPSTRGGSAYDKQNLNFLLKLLREKLKDKLLTIAVSANPRTVETAYDVRQISLHVDFINLMSYDYHGAFDTVTGHNAPLFEREEDEDRTFNVLYGLKFWVKKGAPKNKINLGLPLYGRAVQLSQKDQNSLFSPIIGPGVTGEYSTEAGVLYYREICQRLQSEKWIKKWDPISMVPYMYSDDQWVTYDDERSLALKVYVAMKMELGGIMFWSLESDDFQNKCEKGSYSLVKSAKDSVDKSLLAIETEKLMQEEAEKRQAEEEKHADCSESGVDGVIILSQLKSLFEWASGKSHCAKRTQENFIKLAPVISQSTSFIQYLAGDEEAARQTQIAFIKNVEAQINGVPVIGHIKAAVHCLSNQLEKCADVYHSANQGLIVLAGTAGGFFTCGPACAALGATGAAATFDGITSAIEQEPQGLIKSIPGLFNGENNPSENFDLAVELFGYATAGRGLGKVNKGKPGIKYGEKGKGKSKSPTKSLHPCRWKRSGGSSGCSKVKWFEDIEKFEPIQELRIIKSNLDKDGPVQAVQLGYKGRLEYTDADIGVQHLQIKSGDKQRGSGSATNRDTQGYSDSMSGNKAKQHGIEKQDAGHAIAQILGGSGKHYWNIFPQSKHFNRGIWRGLEEVVYNEVLRTGGARYTLKFLYDSPTDTRPSSIRYRMINKYGLKFQGDILNPNIANADINFLKKQT